MHRTHQDQLAWNEQRSPTGKFCVYRKHLSLALGGRKDIGPLGGGHPFDVELTRVPPGAVTWRSFERKRLDRTAPLRRQPPNFIPADAKPR